MRTLQTLAEVDEALAEAERLASVSNDEFVRYLNGFRLALRFDDVGDPHGEAYRQAQMQLYSHVSRRDYALEHEASVFDVEAMIERPFPYCTESAATVGAQLMAIGHVIKLMALPPGASILEMGPGWGNTTLALAQMGYRVTALDIERRFVDLVRERASRIGCAIELIEDQFLAVETLERQFDAILFFESFHHCHDHLRLLRALEPRLARGGKLVFAGEPIVADLSYPWGLNPQGEAIWQIRRNGWLELVFREDYFVGTLRCLGWDVSKYDFAYTAAGVGFVATRPDDDVVLSDLPRVFVASAVTGGADEAASLHPHALPPLPRHPWRAQLRRALPEPLRAVLRGVRRRLRP